jgi:hypothetical protein
VGCCCDSTNFVGSSRLFISGELAVYLRVTIWHLNDIFHYWMRCAACMSERMLAIQEWITRMSDKYIRVTNLVRKPENEQVGENIKDTLMDLAAYALIAVCLLEEQETQ